MILNIGTVKYQRKRDVNINYDHHLRVHGPLEAEADFVDTSMLQVGVGQRGF